MATPRYLTGNQIALERPPQSVHLRLTILDELCVISVRIKRIFPLSIPGDYLSLQNSAGEEVAILKGVDTLSTKHRKLVDQELDRTYFTPAIERIDFLKMEAGMWHFDVLTQRGPGTFYVRNWRDNAHEISTNRWQINSVDGARFEIRDIEKLDARSTKLLEQLL